MKTAVITSNIFWWEKSPGTVAAPALSLKGLFANFEKKSPLFWISL